MAVRWLPVNRLALPVLALGPMLPQGGIADVPTARARVIEIQKRDNTADGIAAFMRSNGFAKPYYVKDIVEGSAAASIPPSLLVCIEFYESSGGKYYDRASNNPLGWDSGKSSFASVPAAIRQVTAQLGSGTYYAGKTIAQKLKMYNPRPIYAVKIMDCMKRVEARVQQPGLANQNSDE
jgi:hypothetical protein